MSTDSSDKAAPVDNGLPAQQLADGPVIRLRAVVAALLLVVVLCAVTPYSNIVHQTTPLGGGHFPLAPFVVLVLLSLSVALVGRIFGRAPWLSGKELILVWALMALASGIAYTGLVRTFFINLTAPYHFASAGNRWAETLQPLLPQGLFPQSQAAVQSLYNGIVDGREMSWLQLAANVPWEAWIRPLMAWGVFILLCYAVIVCLVNLFSRQWLQKERMNFPLLQVPLTLSEAVDSQTMGRLIRDRYLLTGLSIPIGLHLLNGIHFYHPAIPQIPTLILTGSYFPQTGLFAAFYKLKIYIYPAFIGFAFLATRQISFSFWFFFLMGGLVSGVLSMLGYSIPAASLGITFGHSLARVEETQMVGAYGAFFLFIVWLARDHLLQTVRQALGSRHGQTTDQNEWLSLPASFWGVVAGTAGIVLWCTFFGIPFWAGLLLIGAFFMVTIVVSRIICQGGVAFFNLNVAPIDGLIGIFGPRFFGSVGLVVAAVAQKVLFLDFRESLMPAMFQTRKVTQRTGGRRLILIAIAAALFLGVVVSIVSMLMVCYRYGIRELPLEWASSTTLVVYENAAALIKTPVRPSGWVLIFSLAGAVVMLVLVVCYHRYYWWPIHPIGYLTAYSTSMRHLWFAFLIGWICNALCMRYGGVALFKRMRMLFIGLIIGDFLMGAFWTVIGLFNDTAYHVLPT